MYLWKNINATLVCSSAVLGVFLMMRQSKSVKAAKIPAPTNSTISKDSTTTISKSKSPAKKRRYF